MLVGESEIVQNEQAGELDMRSSRCLHLLQVFFLILIFLQLMLVCSSPHVFFLAFVLVELVIDVQSFRLLVIFEAALTTVLFLYAIVFSHGKGRPRNVVVNCYS